MTGLCATCRHWANPEPDYAYEEVTLGTCKAIPHRETLMQQSRLPGADWDTYEQTERVALAGALAIACDASGYNAQVKTQATFGCVLHEAKP